MQFLAEDSPDWAVRLDLLDRAIVQFDSATRAFGQLGHKVDMAGARFGVATTWALKANATRDAGMRARAIEDLVQALHFFQMHNLPDDCAMVAMALGDARLMQAGVPGEDAMEHVESAAHLFARSAEHYAAAGQPHPEATAQQKLALIRERQAETAPAAEARDRLQAAEAALLRSVELIGGDDRHDDVPDVGAALERIRNRLAELD